MWVTLDPRGESCDRCTYWVPDSAWSLPSNPVILLGAGASADAGLPSSVGLAHQVLQDVLALPSNSLAYGAHHLAVNLHRDLMGCESKPDIETLLTAIHLIAESAPTLRGLRRILAEQYRESVMAGLRLGYVVWERVMERLNVPSEDSVAYLGALPSLRLCDDMPLHVFTLNYDLCVEIALTAVKVPFATGFDSEGWNPGQLAAMQSGVRLYKLHGSLDWSGRLGGLPPIVLGFQEKIGLVDPFWYLWNEFVKVLAHANICVVIGYSFRDEHVNSVLHQAAARGVDFVIVEPSYDVVLRWAWRLQERSDHLSPLFFGTKEALQDGHALHALHSVRTLRSLESKGIGDFRSDWDRGENIRFRYIAQHHHPPESAG